MRTLTVFAAAALALAPLSGLADEPAETLPAQNEDEAGGLAQTPTGLETIPMSVAMGAGAGFAAVSIGLGIGLSVGDDDNNVSTTTATTTTN